MEEREVRTSSHGRAQRTEALPHVIIQVNLSTFQNTCHAKINFYFLLLLLYFEEHKVFSPMMMLYLTISSGQRLLLNFLIQSDSYHATFLIYIYIYI